MNTKTIALTLGTTAAAFMISVGCKSKPKVEPVTAAETPAPITEPAVSTTQNPIYLGANSSGLAL